VLIYFSVRLEAHTGEIAAGVAGGLLLILAVVLLVLYRNWRYEQELDSLLWKVDYKDIQELHNGTSLSTKITRVTALPQKELHKHMSVDLIEQVPG
jgi:hypothetical protein